MKGIAVCFTAETLSGASFGEGTGRIWLRNVQCTGNETKLSNCLATFNMSITCSHAQDVAVRCTTGKPNYYSVERVYLFIYLLFIYLFIYLFYLFIYLFIYYLFIYLFLFQDVLKETLGCWKVVAVLMVVWKFVEVMCGVQCVMMDGVMLMHK